MRYPEFPTQRLVLHFLPFAFCSFLSLMALFGPGSGSSGAWTPAFISFVPMCFFYMGATTVGLQREINDLKLRLQTAAPAATKAQ